LSVPAASKPAARAGLAARSHAAAVLHDVTERRRPLDERLEALAADEGWRALSPGDRALSRAIAVTAIRHLGIIRHALAARMEGGMPASSGNLKPLLLAGAAQVLFLGVHDHAAVDTAVSLAREDRHAKHFAGLANALLRRIAREKAEILAGIDPLLHNTPDWLAGSWTAAYGEATARAIAAAHLLEPPLDISVKGDAEAWADRLGARLLPTGSLRLKDRTAVPLLPGFAEGAWWVQDAAAALPARLIGAKPGTRVLDLCAAPGGKTAQLAAAGAHVTAVDRSRPRLDRLEENLKRLSLTAEVVPCSATGTIRRHPDVAFLKTREDLLKLVALQERVLDNAAALVKPGGTLVYAVCSLEPAEGERQAERFLAHHPDFRLVPVTPDEAGGTAGAVTPAGMLRTLPVHMPDDDSRMAGLDGFFAARFARDGLRGGA
jgi:16S rRNA (cytosine967-C5)-methyltransferase